MFDKILIANRGEIACRVIKTANRLGIKCVAVYSDADESALHVDMADEAYHIGASSVAESYLKIDKIIDTAIKSGAQAIHPGYGFLSENPDFVHACDQAGICFIGPGVEAIQAMGLKDAAKKLMEKSAVPIVPGYHGDKQQADFLEQKASECGYPVLIKARAGGGGKGMRRVDSADDFGQALKSAQREAKSSFADAHVIIEKFISSPRHIEVQVFADKQGNTVHLFERDCSMQRRHQKVIEEAPAPGMTAEMRQAMGSAAVRAAKAVNYVGAGTVEFIVDGSSGLTEDSFYFMEMNTRLQVEHPVTEYITGQDLVEWQLRVAAGESLPLLQDQLSMTGHAFEARIYAEDADNNFMPSTGNLDYLSLPHQYARVDSGVRQNDEISPFYDPMIAKIIVHGHNRDSALTNLTTALSETQIVGCKTNVDFLSKLARHEGFAAARIDTGLIDENYQTLTRSSPPDTQVISIAALASLGYLTEVESDNPWRVLTGWRHFTAAKQFAHLVCDGRHIEVMVMVHANKTLELEFEDHVVPAKIIKINGDKVAVDFSGRIVKAKLYKRTSALYVFQQSNSFKFELLDYASETNSGQDSDKNVHAPMPGLITAVNVKEGQSIKKGEVLIVMEAMKMEHSLKAKIDGVVTGLNVAQGDQVTEGALFLRIEQGGNDG